MGIPRKTWITVLTLAAVVGFTLGTIRGYAEKADAASPQAGVKAVATPTPQGNGSRSAIDGATQLQACEKAHGLAQAHMTQSNTQTFPDRVNLVHTTFSSCEWPPPRYADADGYSVIRVVNADGPGASEADGTNTADRIVGPCAKYHVAYTFGTQGYSEHLQPFTASPNTIVTADGRLWTGARSTVPFYPERNELVVLHNYKHGIDSVSCVR